MPCAEGSAVTRCRQQPPPLPLLMIFGGSRRAEWGLVIAPIIEAMQDPTHSDR